MKGKIMLMTFAVGLLLILTNSQAPKDHCTRDGQTVCINCQLTGFCAETSDNNFEVEDGPTCGDPITHMDAVCVESAVHPEANSTCFRANQPTCYCNGTKKCIPDPYNEYFYIECTGDDMNTTGDAIYCTAINFDDCSCSSTTLPSTNLSSTTTEETSTTTEEPTTTDSSQITTEETSTTTEEPTTTDLSQITTEETSTTTEQPPTTDLSQITTEEPSTTTEEPTTTDLSQITTEEPSTTTEEPSTITVASQPTTEATQTTTEAPQTTTEEPPTTTKLPVTTTTELSCTDECPFAEDNSDPNDCGAYVQCTAGGNIPGHCPDDLCFDQDLCQCTVAFTTPSTCPTDGCQLFDDPNDPCSKYYLCQNGHFIEYECPSSQCFDQESCGCISSSPASTTSTTLTTSTLSTISTTTTTTTNGPITCPSGCPFVDYPDPNAPCSNFYICSEGNLVPAECPGGLCFDQNTCQCVP